jgi:putative membrane protein
MITKLHILSLAVAAALAGCASDNVAWRDSSGRDTTGANYNSGSDYNNGIRDNGSTYNTGLPDNPQAALNDKTRSLQAFSARDNGFIRDVEAGDAYEISAGQKALIKSSDEQVKSLAQHMVDDHSKADKQIIALATRHGVSTTNGMTGQQIDMLKRLDNLTGADFDREYLSQQEQAHKDTIAKFQDAGSNADSQDVRDWANATLPTLQSHLTMIQTRNGNMNNNTNNPDINRTPVTPATPNDTNLNNRSPSFNNSNPNTPSNVPGANPSDTGAVGTPGSSGMNK